MTNHQIKKIKIKAVEKALAIAGSQTALAAVFGRRQQIVGFWLKEGLPLKHAPVAARVFKEIPLAEFAPEIYSENDTNQTLRKS